MKNVVVGHAVQQQFLEQKSAKYGESKRTAMNVWGICAEKDDDHFQTE